MEVALGNRNQTAYQSKVVVALAGMSAMSFSGE